MSRPVLYAVSVVALTLAACGRSSSPSAPSPAAAATPAATPTPTPTPEPTPEPTPAPTPTPAPSGPTVLREASFQSANGYTTEGRAAIIRENGGHRLELRSDFRTSNSGALEVRLCRATGCQSNDLNLGSIQAFRGSQRYTLPNDAGGFRYVVIWCTAVNLPFGFGDLG